MLTDRTLAGSFTWAMAHRPRGVTATVLVTLWCLACCVQAQTPSARSYVIGPQDVIGIVCADDPTLSGHFTVQDDGTFNLLYVGSIKAAGFTIQEFESELKRRLIAAEILKSNAHVSVTVDQYKSKRIFVMGEVRSPNTFPLSGGMTLIDALALAGYPINGAGEVIIVRANKGKAPATPDGDVTEADIIHADVSLWQTGALDKNILLEDGDLITVAQAESAYLIGEIGRSGAYPVNRRNMTVQQLIALAGGFTPDAARNRVTIERTQNGKKIVIKVDQKDMAEIVKPGDTIKVPTRRL